MNGREPRLPPVAPAGASAADLRTVAIDALDRALDRQPPEVGEQVDVAERAAARLRDALIDRLRSQPSGSQSSGSQSSGSQSSGSQSSGSQPTGSRKAHDATATRSALDQVNVALSLIAGVEYPGGGFQRRMLEQARDTLRNVKSEGLE